ncbi:MAG: PAS domain-containing protein [Rhodospirillales bacterium]
MNDYANLYRLHEVDFADNPVPDFETALSYWERQRGDAFAPAWRDFDLMEVPLHMLSACMVVDVPPGDGPLRYRFFGSAIAASHGFELTGKTSDDIQSERLRHHVINQYRTIVDGRRPRLFTSEIYVKQGVPKRDLLLRLPLSDDGETVTGVVSFEHQFAADTI